MLLGSAGNLKRFGVAKFRGIPPLLKGVSFSPESVSSQRVSQWGDAAKSKTLGNCTLGKVLGCAAKIHRLIDWPLVDSANKLTHFKRRFW